jgi:DNA-binding response OmpR family regulator
MRQRDFARAAFVFRMFHDDDGVAVPFCFVCFNRRPRGADGRRMDLTSARAGGAGEAVGRAALDSIRKTGARSSAEPALYSTIPPAAAAVVRFKIAPPVAGSAVEPDAAVKGGSGFVSPKATILIVDDEPDVRDVLQEYLASQGYAAIGADGADAARALVAAQPVDLALIDIHMPGEDGLSLARHLRERYASVAIVMLTSSATVVDRIVGLEMGADDYVPKPFDPRELLARVRSVLRRMSSANRAELGDARVRIGRCVLDVAAHRLTNEQGEDVPMSPLEFDLLKALAENPNRALSRERILNLNQRDWDPFDRSVDLRIMRLRKKIEPDPEHPRFIRTIRNEGYIFVPDGS